MPGQWLSYGNFGWYGRQSNYDLAHGDHNASTQTRLGDIGSVSFIKAKNKAMRNDSLFRILGRSNPGKTETIILPVIRTFVFIAV